MDHDQFETLIAAILTAGMTSHNQDTHRSDAISMLVDIRRALRAESVISRMSASFVPKVAR
jgi:hypothetical protein